MIDFIKNLTSPSWWVSSVICGIALSIAGAYAKDYIDIWLGLISKKRQEANSMNVQKWDSEINEIRVNENLKLLKIAEISDTNHRSLFCGLIGLSFFLVGTSLSNFIQSFEPIEASNIGIFWYELGLHGKFEILIGFQLLCCILGSLIFVLGAYYFYHSKKIYLQIKEAITKD